MLSIIRTVIASAILAFTLNSSPILAADNYNNQTTVVQPVNNNYMSQQSMPVYAPEMPRALDYKFRDMNDRISDIKVQLYIGLFGLFLVVLVAFFYLKWNMQSLSMSVDNLRHRQDDLIKLLQMNNGKLQKNINKLERSLYDLNEKQAKISKKFKNGASSEEAEKTEKAD